jgi:hypothetical protein
MCHDVLPLNPIVINSGRPIKWHRIPPFYFKFGSGYAIFQILTLLTASMVGIFVYFMYENLIDTDLAQFALHTATLSMYFEPLFLATLGVLLRLLLSFHLSNHIVYLSCCTARIALNCQNQCYRV